MNEAEFRRLLEERPDLARQCHFVKRRLKDGSPGYFRKVPRIYTDRKARSEGQLKVQLTFAKAARNAYGKRGFRFNREGRPVPVVAAECKKAVEGKRFRKPKMKEIIKMLEEGIRGIGEVLVEKQKKKKLRKLYA